MTREELLQIVFESNIFKEWHWFRYHFEHQLRGYNHPLSEAIIDACIDCERHIPGYAKHVIERIASVGGREKFMPHWEQLLQLLAELHVVRHVLVCDWPEDTTFESEPTSGNDKKNPEIALTTSEFKLGIEVKTPAIFKHWDQRSANPTQLPSRAIPKEQHKDLPDATDGITLPRDNPVKDFLISANEKFAGLRQNGNFFGVLAIVWDDFIYEPISALCHPDCGLLTPNSFAIDDNGNPMSFPAVDAIFIIRHLHQLIRACRDEPLVDSCRSPLDYGRHDDFPWKAFIPVPGGKELNERIIGCFQGREPSPEMGAEYLPKELVWWVPK